MLAYFHLMRLDKPVGIWLTFWPAAWAVLLASGTFQPELLALLFLGASLMRAAGCIMNDLADADFDAQVERTKLRPLASGAISKRRALALLGVLLAQAFGLLFVLPHPAFWLAFATLPLVAAYPFMKRFTWWPQLFLGITFNMSALFGWLEATGELSLSALWLYVAAVFWTLGYDTIYALQDMHDDARIGVKSTALRLGAFTLPFVALCYTHFLAILLWLGVNGGLGWPYFVGMVLCAAQLLWQIRTMRRGGHAGAVFKSNQWLGLLVFLAISAGGNIA